MASRRASKSRPPAPRIDAGETAVGLIGCLIVAVVPFLPDEKLVRLKLEGLELGLWALGLFIALRVFLARRWPVRPSAEAGLPADRESAPFRWLVGAVASWVFVNAILAFLSTDRALALSELRRVLVSSAAFAVFAFAGWSDAWFKRWLAAGAAAGGVLSIYGILQVTGGIGPVAVPQMARVMGTFGNPIFFGAYLAAAVFVSLACAAASRPGWARAASLLTAALELVALYCTKTRASWAAIGATAILSVLLFKKDRKAALRILGILAVLGAAFGVATRNTWERDQGHLLIWRDTLRMWKDHPWTGVGLGAFHTNFVGYAQPDLRRKWPQNEVIINFAHNEYLQTLAEGGVVGFLPVVLLALAFLGTLRRFAAAGRGPETWLALSALAVALQNGVSVDMRFTVSAATMLATLGVLASRSVPVSDRWMPWKKPMTALPWAGAAASVAVFAALVSPLTAPYRAERVVNAEPGFFDQRLLDPAKTIEDLESLARRYPKEPAVLEKLAYVYAKEIKTPDGRVNPDRAEQAIATYQRLLQVDPERASAANNLANTYYTIGRVDEAIALWRRAIQIKPDFIDVHLNLGKVLYVRGQLKESAAELQEVLKLDPGNAEATVYLKRMVE